MGIIHARFARAHQLNVHSFVLRFLRKRLIVVCARNSIATTYPFYPVQVIIRTDMVFCLPTILDNVLSRERHFGSMPPEELPELLTLIVRYYGLNLIEIKPRSADSEFGRRSTVAQ